VTTRANLAVHFYDCDLPTRDQLVASGSLSRCETTLLAWLERLTVANESWRPQAEQRGQLATQVVAAQVAALAQCLASRFAPLPTPASGLVIQVASHVDGVRGGSETTPADDRLRSLVGLRFSAPSTQGTGSDGCPPIPFEILHRPVVVGGHTFLQNTVLTTAATPPAKTGSGAYADSFVFAAEDQATPWTAVLHKAFLSGTWRINSSKVFNHFVVWDLIQDPPPGAELAARAEAFDLARLTIDLPGFPMLSSLGPRWRVLHRYTHQTSGWCFWFSEWLTPVNTVSASWPTTNPFGRGYNGTFRWTTFTAPDDGAPLDPAGTWIHETGVIDFAMSSVPVEVRYAGALCEQVLHTVSARGIGDPYVASFVADSAVVRDTVEVQTLKAHKAAFRWVELRPIAGIGVFVRLRVVNDFAFAACMVVALPLGSEAVRVGGHRADPVIVRNLGPKSQSDLVEFLLPLATLSGGRVAYSIQRFANGVASGRGFVGLALPSGHMNDGVYLNVATLGAALTLTTDGQRAEAWGFYDTADRRYWHQPSGASSVPLAQEVFAFSPDPGVILGSAYATGLNITVIIRGEKKVAVPGITRSQFPTGNYYVMSGPGYTGRNYSPRYCPSSWIDESGSNLQTIGFALTSTANGVTSVVSSQTYTGFCEIDNNSGYTTVSLSYWLFDNGQGYKIWTWPLGGPYTVAWDIMADVAAITADGDAQYEAARWRWDPFEETQSASMSRETFINRYGRRFPIAAASADGHATTTVVGDWASAAAVEQVLVEGLLSPYIGSTTTRSITHQVTKHPTLVVSRAGLSEADYPGGIPAFLDGQLHVLLQNGTNVVEVVWT